MLPYIGKVKYNSISYLKYTALKQLDQYLDMWAKRLKVNKQMFLFTVHICTVF